MTWTETIEGLEEAYREENKNEPFFDQEYYEEIMRLLALAKRVFIGIETTSSTDRAMHDLLHHVYRCGKGEE